MVAASLTTFDRGGGVGILYQFSSIFSFDGSDFELVFFYSILFSDGS